MTIFLQVFRIHFICFLTKYLHRAWNGNWKHRTGSKILVVRLLFGILYFIFFHFFVICHSKGFHFRLHLLVSDEPNIPAQTVLNQTIQQRGAHFGQRLFLMGLRFFARLNVRLRERDARWIVHTGHSALENLRSFFALVLIRFWRIFNDQI